MRPIDADALKEKINVTFWSEIGAIIDNAPTIEPSGDLISRADAICEVLVNDGTDNIVDRINALPSADRPTGEWVKATGMMPPEFHGHHCCSECGNFANMEPPFGNREDLSEFCPNCGADMQPDK